MEEPSTSAPARRGRPPGSKNKGNKGTAVSTPIEQLAAAQDLTNTQGRYFASRAGAGPADPQAWMAGWREQQDREGIPIPKPAPSLSHISQDALTAGLAADRRRVGVLVPYLLSAAAAAAGPSTSTAPAPAPPLELLRSMKGITTGNILWPLDTDLPARAMQLAAVLAVLCGLGQQLEIPNSQLTDWDARVQRAVDVTGCSQEDAELAMALLTPLHGVSYPTLLGEPQYASPCVEWDPDKVEAARLVYGHTDKEPYLRVSLGVRKPGGQQEAVSDEEGEEQEVRQAAITTRAAAAAAKAAVAGAGSSGTKVRKPKVTADRAQTTEYGHRLVLWMAVGPPPTQDMKAMHLCHNPRCLNPQHLVWGTQQERMGATKEAYEAAMRREGRQLWGRTTERLTRRVVEKVVAPSRAKGKKGTSAKATAIKAKATKVKATKAKSEK